MSANPLSQGKRDTDPFTELGGPEEAFLPASASILQGLAWATVTGVAGEGALTREGVLVGCQAERSRIELGKEWDCAGVLGRDCSKASMNLLRDQGGSRASGVGSRTAWSALSTRGFADLKHS